MGKYGFLAKCISSLNYKRMTARAREIAEKNDKNTFAVLCDMIYCGLRFQAGYEDYVLFDFVNLPNKQRDTYMTRGINNQIVKKYNDIGNNKTLLNKRLFHEAFKDFTKREYLDMDVTDFETFARWVQGRDDFIIKPYAGGCGRGVEKIKPDDYADLKEIYDYIRAKPNMLAEETVIQDEKISAIYPDAINTLRIVTLYNKEKDEVCFPFTAIRIGNGGVVDNINSGGMTSVIDTETGIIKYPAADKKHRMYETHPLTGTKIKGFQIPYWNEILEFAAAAARRLPDLGYVGWDVAISAKGLVLIEGNDYPGHDIYQMPGMVENKTGLKPRFEKLTGMKL